MLSTRWQHLCYSYYSPAEWMACCYRDVVMLLAESVELHCSSLYGTTERASASSLISPQQSRGEDFFFYFWSTKFCVKKCFFSLPATLLLFILLSLGFVFVAKYRGKPNELQAQWKAQAGLCNVNRLRTCVAAVIKPTHFKSCSATGLSVELNEGPI